MDRDGRHYSITITSVVKEAAHLNTSSEAFHNPSKCSMPQLPIAPIRFLDDPTRQNSQLTREGTH